MCCTFLHICVIFPGWVADSSCAQMLFLLLQLLTHCNSLLRWKIPTKLCSLVHTIQLLEYAIPPTVDALQQFADCPAVSFIFVCYVTNASANENANKLSWATNCKTLLRLKLLKIPTKTMQSAGPECLFKTLL